MRWLWLGLSMCVGCNEAKMVRYTQVILGSTPLPQVAGTGAALEFTVREDGDLPAVGLALHFAAGQHGSVSPDPATTDGNGVAHVVWTLGKTPVPQKLTLSRGWPNPVGPDLLSAGLEETWSVDATLPQPWTTETWGDVETVLKDVQGSTEDLAFGPDGLVMGQPGGLLQVDAQGHATPKVLKGDPIEGPLGMAYDTKGNLWVADSKGHALRKVAADGTVSTIAAVTVQMPNDVAVDAQGRVWVTDTCGGTLQRYDPAAGKVDATLKFDGAQDGGPNGATVDAQGSVWMTTENTVLFCKVPGEVEDPVASLYRIDLDAQGQPKAPVAVLAHFAFSGDGLTLDAEGNLYVIFDLEKDFALTESTVFFIAKGTTAPVRFLTATDRTFANVVFGKGSYGKTQLFLSLVAVPPFTTARGLQRFDVGIPGP
jgi:hypothetical protein